MTPEQKIKWMVLERAYSLEDRELPEVNGDNIDDLYQQEDDESGLQDIENEVRESGEETAFDGAFSRNYDCDVLAGQAPDGSWIAWNYWHGGGKHGDPQSLPWMESAFDVDCVEEEKIMIVRTFKKKEDAK